MGPMIVEAAEVAVDLPIAIRPASPDELRLVQATWARGVRAQRVTQVAGLVEIRCGDIRCALDKSLWARAHHLLVDALLASPTIAVAVAVTPEMPETPVGWAAWDREVLHFVHVVPVARRCRVATKLVLHTRARSASHMTSPGRGLVRYLQHGNAQDPQ